VSRRFFDRVLRSVRSGLVGFLDILYYFLYGFGDAVRSIFDCFLNRRSAFLGGVGCVVGSITGCIACSVRRITRVDYFHFLYFHFRSVLLGLLTGGEPEGEYSACN
jgi:hypothetical protein